MPLMPNALSEQEETFLRQGGAVGVGGANKDAAAANVTIIAGEYAQMVATAHSQQEVAARLSVSTSRIRQRLALRSPGFFFAAGDYPSTWDAFRHYGPSASRFDHHVPDDDGVPQVQERGVMYLAAGSESLPTCLAEVFQATRIIDRYSRDPILAGFELRDSLTLRNLRGTFATAIGASTAIHSGQRPRARRWA